MADRAGPLEALALPAEVRAGLAELELELSEGDITQKGYEKKRAKLLTRYVPLIQGVDAALPAENRISGPSQIAATAPKQQKQRPTNSRDERFRSDVHTEAVQAALAKYKERKMPMPSKRRSVLAHACVETYTPPDTSSASEDEGSLRRPGRLSSTPLQSHSSAEPWLDRAAQGSSSSSSASSTSSHLGGRPAASGPAVHAHVGVHAAPPDVTTGLEEHAPCERPQLASVRGVPWACSRSVLETAGGQSLSLWSSRAQVLSPRRACAGHLGPVVTLGLLCLELRPVCRHLDKSVCRSGVGEGTDWLVCVWVTTRDIRGSFMAVEVLNHGLLCVRQVPESLFS